MNYAEELEIRQNMLRSDVCPDFSDGITLRLELSNICNHKCLCCPNSKMKRKRCHMPSELVYRLLKEGEELGIKEVGLFIAGEPFVSPELEDYIKFAKEHSYEYVFITTNGALATPARLEKVIDAGIDSIKFSINAGTRESYKVVHGRDDYDKVFEHLKHADQYRKRKNAKVKLMTSFVVTKYTKDEIDMHYNKILPYVDDICFFNAESFGGQMEEEIKELRVKIDNDKMPQYTIPNKIPCVELFKTICVTAEGFMTCCCSEAFNYLVVEDVNSMLLREAWHSESMQNIRRRHIEGNIDGTQCYKCIYGKEKGKTEPLNKELYIKSLDENKE